MFLRYGRGQDYQCGSFVFASLRYEIDILFVMDLCSFFYKMLSQFTGSTVIACHYFSFRKKIADEGTHSDTACPDKIYRLNRFYIHDCCANFITSFAITTAESGKARCAMFSLSSLSFSALAIVSSATGNSLFSASTSFT